MSDRASDFAMMRRLWRWAGPHARLYAIALVCAPTSALLTIAQPWLLKVAIDQHIVTGDLDGLYPVVGLYLLAILGGFALEVGYSLSMAYGALRTIHALRRDVVAHTLAMGQRFFDTRPSGVLLTRATSDVEALSETLTAGAITIALDALLVVGILGAMFRMDAGLATLLLFTAPPLLLLVEGVRRVLRGLYQQVRDSTSELNALVSERLGGFEIVQLYSDEARTEALHDARLARYQHANVRTNVWDALIYAAMDGFSAVGIGLMIWWASGGVTGQMLTAGVVVAFVDYLGKLFDPIKEFSAKLAILQRAAASLEKLFALLDTQEGPAPGREDAAPRAPAIEARDLRFAYGDGPDVLRGLDLRVGEGEVVALVGRTGSGKTTVGKLLTRAYDGYRGALTVGGVEVRELPAPRSRALVGCVRQDVQLFPDSVRFNLTLGADIPDATLMEAVRAARAEAVVQQLGGLDGQVAPGAGNLSVGQAQLLSFARTLAHAPPIVVLDEATASVDTLTEALIQEATAAILRGRTVIVIAHRLSTVVNADRIVVLSEGRALEVGTHAELLAKGGAYAALYHGQQLDNPPPTTPSTDSLAPALGLSDTPAT